MRVITHTKEIYVFFMALPHEATNKVAKSKWIKRILIYSNIGYIYLILISILIAIFFGNSEYSLWIHPVSDLGSRDLTPAPYIFDFACIFAGMVAIPTFILIEKRFDHPDLSKQVRSSIPKWGSLIGMVGAISSILVGIYSTDKAGPGGMYHVISAGCAFGGFVFSIIFYSIFIILLYDSKILKLFGIYGLFCPLTFMVLWVVSQVPLFEWILFFSIISFVIPLNIFVLKS